MKIERKIHLQKLIDSKHNGMIKVITGMRRSGKSFLLFNLFKEHLTEYGIDSNHIIELDLEDMHNLKFCNPANLLEFIDSKICDNGMHYVLLDEIQRVKGFEDVLNSYLKKPNIDIYVTGSNSRMLSTDVITEFRGRGYEIRIRPLGFKEFASVFKGTKEEALREYVLHGGMPQVATMPTSEAKDAYLKSLFVGTYLRDVKERYRIQHDADLSEIVDVLASGIGTLTNARILQNTFKTVKHSSISYETIKRYLDILQDAFILEKSVRYDIRGRKYIDTPSKYYFEDLGLRNATLNFRQLDGGHLMENMIYNELRLRNYQVDVGVVTHDYKDAGGTSRRANLEVDFVCNQGFKRYYIQSALNMATEQKMEQEQKSLIRISDNFAKMIIVGGLTPSHVNDNGIQIVNIFDFLMNDEIPLL